MEWVQCPECDNPVPVDIRQQPHDCFRGVRGKLSYLPGEFKYWKNKVQEYRDDWEFLPVALRYRVGDQLMAFDYLRSLQDWLELDRTLEERQKVLAAMTLASVYEGILGELVERNLVARRRSDPVFEEVIKGSRYKDLRLTFGPVLGLARRAKIINDDWYHYFDHMREIRNWVHLDRKEKGETTRWLAKNGYQQLDERMMKFRIYIKPRFV